MSSMRADRLANEALTCVFHQGPSDQLKMTVVVPQSFTFFPSIRHMQRS
ncbi:hypothetical protein ALO40_200125 [Pseudomonas syringae pv. viburni]|uniref:Transcriptional regulator n=1 Tax=Pseudomonas syringae pv. viburni TaxID=251703 RepID=A0A0Q0F7A9_9PSED|nr:hypothetical protein ALO40_200125 [Pseudomonas syringae pv. viburni]